MRICVPLKNSFIQLRTSFEYKFRWPDLRCPNEISWLHRNILLTLDINPYGTLSFPEGETAQEFRIFFPKKTILKVQNYRFGQNSNEIKISLPIKKNAAVLSKIFPTKRWRYLWLPLSSFEGLDISSIVFNAPL